VTDVFVSHVELGYFMLYEEEEGTFDTLRKIFLNEAERVILFTEGLWTPANCNGKIINDTVKKEFEIIPENYTKRKKDSRIPYSLGSNALGGVFENVTYKTPEKYYNNGVKKLVQKKYDLASKYFKEAVEYKNDYTDAYYNLGIAELKSNNLKAACAAWNMAIQYGDVDSKDLIKQFCK
jgi:tetratricopeptide (TPR) repeat protein